MRKEHIMKDQDFTAALAKNTLDDIPTPKSDAKDIVGLVKSRGRITGYQLSDGNEGNNLNNLPSVSGKAEL